jgi:membrane-associated protein
MTTDGTAEDTAGRDWRRWRPSRRNVVAGSILLVVLVAVAPALSGWLTPIVDGLLDNTSDDPVVAYATVALLVIGDAVFPVLPGETTVSTAAVAAADGGLNIWWVCVAASAGAVIGDSALYWIARGARGRVRAKMEAAAADPRARNLLELFDDRAALLIIVGRYVPGARFVINFTMGGVVRMPYRRFLPLSAIGGTLWGFYTALLAYLVATVFGGALVVSLIVSGVVTSVAIAWVLIVLRRDFVGSGTASD